ncbi:hypothetical protein A2363_04380 [Candidatus Gottesmanbacteria bacterium RIFOXYB1_FULL_47_11]|uniref:Transcriptional regulator n=1 Tax=Candidatus Gottesmanbacteria bacterium RIFOXYB1_FULL_47_11 TaxID=1798401 RepID=A0A1F6BF19_9BACT|nr:MAG: hypothetical protein A2363_04380 [Candidatus Gottesmanbacteria bacterium RIFOXYB1_FULL_47_11]
MPKGIPRDQSVQHAILHRFQIIDGNVSRIIDMVKHGEYCIDIIHQTMAVESALKKVNQLILKNHMETCVAAEIKKGNTDEVIAEVMRVMEKK